MKVHLTSVVFFPKTQNPSLSMRKTSYKLKLRDMLQNLLAVLYKSIKVMKSKKKLRH